MENNQVTTSPIPSSTEPKSNESLTSIYTRCVNDDSNGSILSDWMDPNSDREENENLKNLERAPSQYFMDPMEEKEMEIREVKSEYAFDINSY